jgi:hypothetical protein
MDIKTLQAGTRLANIVKLTGCRKRRVILARPTEKVSISGSYWDEGSRSDYFLVDLNTNLVTPIPGVSPPQFGGPKSDPEVHLLVHQAVVCAGTFCGRPATPTIYFHPAYEM